MDSRLFWDAPIVMWNWLLAPFYDEAETVLLVSYMPLASFFA